MKKTYGRFNSFLLIFMATLLVLSCRKEVELKQAKIVGKKASYEQRLHVDLDSLKMVFYQKHFDKLLIDEMDLGTITWAPNWPLAFRQIKDSTTYLYIPLLPELMKEGSS